MISQSIDYKNFHPSDKLLGLLQETLEHVYSKSPISSEVKLRVEKQGRTYTAYGTVDTPKGVYVGYADAEDVYDCVREMGLQLSGRLIHVRRAGGTNDFKKSS